MSTGSTRGRRTERDDERQRQDAFDTEPEWIDDEGAAPGVLD